LAINQEEEKIFNSVANLYGGKLSTPIKQLALEKIEDEYDMQLIKDFEEREVCFEDSENIAMDEDFDN